MGRNIFVLLSEDVTRFVNPGLLRIPHFIGHFPIFQNLKHMNDLNKGKKRFLLFFGKFSKQGGRRMHGRERTVAADNNSVHGYSGIITLGGFVQNQPESRRPSGSCRITKRVIGHES
jgi:hypothetical protein